MMSEERNNPVIKKAADQIWRWKRCTWADIYDEIAKAAKAEYEEGFIDGKEGTHRP